MTELATKLLDGSVASVASCAPLKVWCEHLEEAGAADGDLLGSTATIFDMSPMGSTFNIMGSAVIQPDSVRPASPLGKQVRSPRRHLLSPRAGRAQPWQGGGAPGSGLAEAEGLFYSSDIAEVFEQLGKEDDCFGQSVQGASARIRPLVSDDGGGTQHAVGGPLAADAEAKIASEADDVLARLCLPPPRVIESTAAASVRA